MIYTQIIQLKDRLHERIEHEELHRERYDIRMRTSVKRYKVGLIAEPEEPPAALENGAVWKCGVEIWRGEYQLRCRPRHLTAVHHYVVRPEITLVLLQNGTLI
ncbi:hypothetical protein AVEN_96015-1 [Araneus ventricosus]|uniref:Uncharacterized protein n=1 Tax=Araneus ventricosus TaxID=182803 RepID=A0A4Y2B638_ARAVE|nr:hypothetical protein AVEN_96015-1 [Araneus ventricosus]